MLIVKKDKSHHHKTISFNQFVGELEATGQKQNRVKLNYRLLSNEDIYFNEITYFNQARRW